MTSLNEGTHKPLVAGSIPAAAACMMPVCVGSLLWNYFNPDAKLSVRQVKLFCFL